MREENNSFLPSLTETVFILWGFRLFVRSAWMRFCRITPEMPHWLLCEYTTYNIYDIGVIISLIFPPDCTYTCNYFLLLVSVLWRIIVNCISPSLRLIAPCRWEEEEYVPVLSTWHGWTSCPVTWGHLSYWSEETRKMSSPSIASDTLAQDYIHSESEMTTKMIFWFWF